MIWNTFFWLTMLCTWLLCCWTLLRRSSLGWSGTKTGSFNLAVICFGFLLLFLFDITSCSILPGEVQGQVSQVGLLNRSGTRCEFQITSSNGFRVKLHSIVTDPLKNGDTVRVTYNPWRSEAYTVERLGDSNPQVLFDYRSQSRFYTIRPLVDAMVVLLTAMGCIFGVRKFSLEAARLKSQSVET